jgi:histidinol-phosphate aminotransferase
MRADLAGLPVYSAARPGPVPVRVRASSNEVVGHAPAALVRAVVAAVEDAGRYPPLSGGDLCAALARHHRVDVARIAVADGALSLLDRLLLAHVEPGDRVVLGWRSYEAYPISVRVAGGEPVLVPLDADGRHDLDAMLAAVDERTRAVLVCQPNNPTGTVVDPAALGRFLAALPDHVLAVVDEAYADFSDHPGVAALEPGAPPGVVSLRTFSKSHGLAGLRAGYLVAAPEVAAACRAVSPPFPVSTVAIAAARCSLEHPEWVRERVRTTVAERRRIARLLAGHGLPVLDSAANFVWTPLGSASLDFAATAASAGVLVRPFAGEGVRITVGHPDLAEALLPVLRDRPWA